MLLLISLELGKATDHVEHGEPRPFPGRHPLQQLLANLPVLTYEHGISHRLDPSKLMYFPRTSLVSHSSFFLFPSRSFSSIHFLLPEQVS
jgi:hypothetical protein